MKTRADFMAAIKDVLPPGSSAEEGGAYIEALLCIAATCMMKAMGVPYSSRVCQRTAEVAGQAMQDWLTINPAGN